MASTLKEYDVESEIFHIGTGPVQGCIACSYCKKNRKCVFEGDICEQLVEKMAAADGIIIGSPVYYSGPTGSLCAILDRAFYSAGARFKHKPAAAIVNCRRGGASAAFDRLNKYFTISQMPVVSSQYWNATHGFTPEDVQKDIEGIQVMQTLARNMAWMLKLIKNGEAPPESTTKRVFTSFSDGK
jgi:multimeric flavodoxin WrbA